jgi:hypothetical protein
MHINKITLRETEEFIMNETGPRINTEWAGVPPTSGKKHSNKKLFYLIVVSVVLAGLLSSAFIGGYLMGEKKGEASAKANNNPLTNSVNPIMPQIKTGEVLVVNKDSIKINGKTGEETIKTSDKTLVTQKNETLQLSALKKGDQVTIFLNTDDTATRITVK